MPIAMRLPAGALGQWRSNCFCGWGVTLQVGRSRVRDAMKRILLNLPPSGSTRPWGFTEPLTETSTRNTTIMFLGSKARPMLRADNLAAIFEPTV
jgi:hypothetical protein